MPHIFLTGGTGVIGSALVPQLLDQHDVRLTVLLRAKSHEELQDRARQLLEFCGVDDEIAGNRVQFVAGDVCCEKLGVSSDEYAELVHSITGIIHCAGNVRLNQSIANARRDAVDATIHVLRLAERVNRLNKVDVVSTIGVAGKLPGVVPEVRLSVKRQYHNSYEQAKAEAEELLWNAIENGLPITIHRPSMIVGDSRNGAIPHYQVFYYLCDFLSGSKTWGLLPEFGDATLDIVPADFVAKAIRYTALDQSTAGSVLHLCSGSVPELQLNSLSRQVRQLYQFSGRECPAIRTVGPAIFRRAVRLLAWLGPRQIRRSARTLPYFLDYLQTRQLFSVENTTGKLSRAQIRAPSPNNYLAAVLAPYLLGTRPSIRRLNPAAAETYEFGPLAEIEQLEKCTPTSP
jgi:thioester reductase-like protein